MKNDDEVMAGRFEVIFIEGTVRIARYYFGDVEYVGIFCFGADRPMAYRRIFREERQWYRSTIVVPESNRAGLSSKEISGLLDAGIRKIRGIP